jgi:hypothetical protein
VNPTLITRAHTLQTCLRPLIISIRKIPRGPPSFALSLHLFVQKPASPILLKYLLIMLPIKKWSNQNLLSFIFLVLEIMATLIKPHYIEVIGEFTPRGGIAIFPFASYAENNKKFQELKDNRFMNYAPGKYSMELAKLY